MTTSEKIKNYYLGSAYGRWMLLLTLILLSGAVYALFSYYTWSNYYNNEFDPISDKCYEYLETRSYTWTSDGDYWYQRTCDYDNPVSEYSLSLKQERFLIERQDIGWYMGFYALGAILLSILIKWILRGPKEKTIKTTVSQENNDIGEKEVVNKSTKKPIMTNKAVAYSLITVSLLLVFTPTLAFVGFELDLQVYMLLFIASTFFFIYSLVKLWKVQNEDSQKIPISNKGLVWCSIIVAIVAGTSEDLLGQSDQLEMIIGFFYIVLLVIICYRLIKSK